MPRGDGTGPAWAGGNWKCAGGKGVCMPRCCAGRTFSKDEEKGMLDARLENLKSQEDAVRKRLAELGV
jgi:hypothetical protein